MEKRACVASLRISSFDFPFVVRHSCFFIDFNPHFAATPSQRIFSDKICCDLLEARLVASKFSTIVLGGTAALHAYRVWGAVIF
jgi:hypothetical protein